MDVSCRLDVRRDGFSFVHAPGTEEPDARPWGRVRCTRGPGVRGDACCLDGGQSLRESVAAVFALPQGQTAYLFVVAFHGIFQSRVPPPRLLMTGWEREEAKVERRGL